MADAGIDGHTEGRVLAVMKSSGLTEDEWKAVEEFIAVIESESVFDDGQPVDEDTAIKFLMARKFEVQAAVNTFRNNQISYKKFKLKDMKPQEDPLHQELKSGKFTVLEGKDKNGAVVCMFKAILHYPKLVTHSTVLQSLIFQLDEVMKSLEARRNGLTLIYDMVGAAYANFDFDLSMKVLSLLKGGYPARLKHVYIIAAPLWFRASLVILSSFLKEKIRDRVEVLKNGEDLLEYIPKETLPSELGGAAIVDHDTWLSKCLETFIRRDESGKGSRDKIEDKEKGETKTTTPSNDEGTAGDVGFNKVIDSNSDIEKSHDSTADDIRGDEVAGGIKKDSPPMANSSKPLSEDKGSDSVEQPEQHHVQSTSYLNGSQSEDKASQSTHTEATVPTVVITDTSNEAPVKPPRVPERRPNGFYQDMNKTNDSTASDETSNLSESLEEETGKDFGYSFDEFIKHMKASGRKGIHLEYRELRAMPPLGQFISTRHPINLKKNRYSDVLSFEHSRVKLSQIDDDQFSDYINANYVAGYKHPREYICTQGPMNNTYKDFWRMVWEQNVLVIVMITKCVERGRIKCGQYWPENGNCLRYGQVLAKHTDTVTKEDYTVRQFHLQFTESEEVRAVTHFQFTSWPDFGVLASAEPFHEVLEQVRFRQAEGVEQLRQANETSEEEIRSTIEEPPIVVHCSAGIGRTGTFCCTDINMRMMAEEGRVSIFDTVRRLREQRAFSVQTPAQYEFCHIGVISHMITLRKEQGIETEDLERFLDLWNSQSDPSGK